MKSRILKVSKLHLLPLTPLPAVSHPRCLLRRLSPCCLLSPATLSSVLLSFALLCLVPQNHTLCQVLAYYEKDSGNQCKMHKRRIDALEPIAPQVGTTLDAEAVELKMLMVCSSTRQFMHSLANSCTSRSAAHCNCPLQLPIATAHCNCPLQLPVSLPCLFLTALLACNVYQL